MNMLGVSVPLEFFLAFLCTIAEKRFGGITILTCASESADRVRM